MHIGNKAVERERHPMATVEEIIHDLNGATARYHQIELHPDSHYIITFSTYTGQKGYKRLNFRICYAAEVFQYCIQTALAGLPGVHNFSDDIIVYSKTHEEHVNLHRVFEHLRENGLTLNENKCDYGKSWNSMDTSSPTKVWKTTQRRLTKSTPSSHQKIQESYEVCSG